MKITRKLDIASILAKKSCFLFGPRQCGKTWLTRETLPDAHFFDLLSADTFTRLSRRPSLLGEVKQYQKLLAMDVRWSLTRYRSCRFCWMRFIA